MTLPIISKRKKTTWRIRQKGSYADFLHWKDQGNITTKYPGLDLITDRNGKLTPYMRMRIGHVYKPLKVHNVPVTAIPETEYRTGINYAKDLLYSEEASMARRNGIRNNCHIVTLADGRPAQVSLLYGQRAGSLDSLNYSVTDFQHVYDYVKQDLDNKIGQTQINVMLGEIVGYMQNTQKKYDIIDLDFNSCLTLDRCIDLSFAVNNCASDKILLGVTHTVRGQPSLNYAYNRSIPSLLGALMYYFDIKEYVHNYYHDSVVMFRDTFILTKKSIAK